MPATDTVTPGDWYYNTDTDERAAVVAIETWAGVDTAILQHEDGVVWDEALVDIAGQPRDTVFQQYPVVCHYGESTPEPGGDRKFRGSIFMCPSCAETEWDL
jgi:hypothetical protein